MVFRRELETYKFSLDPIQEYLRQASHFVAKAKDITLDDAKTLVKEKLKNSSIIDPKVTFNQQQENGDMVEDTSKLSEYLKSVTTNKHILAPSFTCYKSTDQEKSLHADFLAINLAKRKTNKKLSFKYKQEGNDYLTTYYDTLQKCMKTNNNGLSGSYGASGTILYNPSAHYTLTSITRSVSSIGNAVTESIVGGNKLLFSVDDCLNYMASIITNINRKSVTNCIEKYKLTIPTVDDVVAMLRYSLDRYHRDESKIFVLVDFISKLDDIDRTAIMYVNDLFHLRKLNDKLIRQLIRNMSERVFELVSNPYEIITKCNESIRILSNFIWSDEIVGMNVNYESLRDSDNLKEQELLVKLASTAYRIVKSLDYFKLLFRTFFTTDILPPNIANMKDMLRDIIVLSDTDSTCGSYGEWVKWFFNGIERVDTYGAAVASAVMTINTEIMDHNIKVFSRNMNVGDEAMDLLAMKNEFYWPVFIPTNMTKHYYADVLFQEGNVLRKQPPEIKGVHLIASNADQALVKRSREMMIQIFEKIKVGEKIALTDYIKEVADIERSIIKRIDDGDISIFSYAKIKPANAYAQGEDSSQYFRHLLWENVFSEKYGSPGEPPYTAIKLPTVLDSNKKINDFLSNHNNTIFSEKMKNFLDKNNKDSLGTINLPISIVSTKGIPEEIKSIIDYKRVVMDNCSFFYIILETLGYYKNDDSLVVDNGY